MVGSLGQAFSQDCLTRTDYESLASLSWREGFGRIEVTMLEVRKGLTSYNARTAVLVISLGPYNTRSGIFRSEESNQELKIRMTTNYPLLTRLKITVPAILSWRRKNLEHKSRFPAFLRRRDAASSPAVSLDCIMCPKYVYNA